MEAVQLCCSLNDTLSQMVHLAIIAGLDCSRLNRYICIKLQILIILFESMTNWASLFTQPRQQARVDGIFHCSEEGDNAVPGLMEIFAESHRNLKLWTSWTWARKKLHLCSIITSAAASPLRRPYLKLKTPWAYGALHIFCTRSRKCFKDQSTRQPFIQYSELYVDEQKGSRHLDPWMLAITNK